MSAPLRILQLSDPHVFSNPTAELVGVNTQTSLQRVVEYLIREHERFDLALLTGDLSHDYQARSYEVIAEILAPLHIPAYCLPGNHDDFALMQQVYPLHTLSYRPHILLRDWQIIMLNSAQPKRVEGYLAESELAFLRDCLQSYPDHFAIIALHHQPVPVGSAWIDRVGLTNPQAFWDVLRDFPHVRLVAFGHVHQAFQEEVQRIRCCSAPSTSIQFYPDSNDFRLQGIPQGFRWYELNADGTFDTAVVRLPQYVGQFVPAAGGY